MNFLNSEKESIYPESIYLFLAWVVSCIATLGSLYFSEIRNFVPCELCWYQRILMYPLPLILGISTFQNDLSSKKFVLPMVIIGWGIAFYHYLLQKVPSFKGMGFCEKGVPCNGEYINWLGFITIPFLSLLSFTMIGTLIVLIYFKNRK